MSTITKEIFDEMWEAAFIFWSEDECAPDAERLNAALDRIFGRYFSQRMTKEHADYYQDGGDAFFYVFRQRLYSVLVCFSYHGNNEFRLLAETEYQSIIKGFVKPAVPATHSTSLSKSIETAPVGRKTNPTPMVVYCIGQRYRTPEEGFSDGPFEELNRAKQFAGTKGDVIFEVGRGGGVLKVLFKWKNGGWKELKPTED